jgi:hypothetical protein
MDDKDQTFSDPHKNQNQQGLLKRSALHGWVTVRFKL